MRTKSFLRLQSFCGVLLPLITVIALLLTIGACGTTDSTTHTVGAIVYGKVQTASGAPVDDAVVTLAHRPDGCDSSDVDRTRDFPDSTGRYRTGLPLLHGVTKNSCFLASVDPPEGSGLAVAEPKQFDADFRPNPPYDSVRVDFALDSLSTQ